MQNLIFDLLKHKNASVSCVYNIYVAPEQGIIADKTVMIIHANYADEQSRCSFRLGEECFEAIELIADRKFFEHPCIAHRDVCL